MAQDNLSKMKSEWVEMLRLESAARGIAAYRLEHESLDTETRTKLEQALDSTDYCIVRLMAGLTVLVADDCPLRRLFIEDGDARVIIIKEMVAIAQLRAQGQWAGALAEQAARMSAAAHTN